MKQLTIFIFVFLVVGAFGQNYEWLSTGRNLNLDIKYASISSSQAMAVFGEIRSSYFIDGNTEMVTRTKTKDSSEVSHTHLCYASDQRKLFYYDREGNVSWSFDIREELVGLQHNAKDNIVMLMVIDGQMTKKQAQAQSGNYYFSDDEEETDEDSEDNVENEDDNDEENQAYYASLEHFNPQENVDPVVASGLYALVLNDDGNLIRITPLILSENLDLDIFSFKISRNGDYAVHGVFGNDFKHGKTKNLPAPAGGECVMVFDQTGKELWSDFLRYNRKTCCSYYSDAPTMTVAPDGSIYLAGAFNTGLLLSNGKEMKVKQEPTKENREPFESYVISYSNQGKINWWKQSGSQNMIHKIVATDAQVIVSYYWNKGTEKSFKIAADTTDRKNTVIAAFSKFGVPIWNTTLNTTRIQQLEIANEKLYIAGASRYGNTSGKIGTEQLPKNVRSFVAIYTLNGAFKQVKPFRTDFDTRSEPVYIFPYVDNQMYVAFSMFVGMNMPLKVYDSLFGDVKNAAEIGVIGKIRF